MQLLIVLCFVLAGVSDAHGLFWSPTSRARLAKESGWTTDATSIISEPMPEVASGRPYPGGRPFAEPGKSMSNVGPCGMETYDSKKTNWNMPAHSWGATQAQYTSGDTIDVSWCVSNLADHGGLYSYRLCTDDDLVAKFTNETHTPNKQEMDQLETCFQKGILKCTDVPGQDCPVHPDCQDGWGCQQAKDWFTCGPKDSGRCESKGQGSCETHHGAGTLLKDRVKLPAGYSSQHTLIGFRWDSEDTPQLWMHCSDISIAPSSNNATALVTPFNTTSN
jgi:hypothetical protein